MDKRRKPSTHYNWFKVGGLKPKKEKQKDILKKILKIFKILIYSLLIVFSLTGCIQSFIVKTDSQVGRGVEIFGDDKYVAPHVSNFNLIKQKNGNLYSSEVGEIYSIGSQKITHLISDEKVLKKINSSLTKQSKDQNYKLSDSYDGKNEVARLLISGKPINLNDGIPEANGNVLVISDKLANAEKTKATYGDVTVSQPDIYILIKDKLSKVKIKWPALTDLKDDAKARLYYSKALINSFFSPNFQKAFNFIQKLPDEKDKAYKDAYSLAKVQTDNWNKVASYFGLSSDDRDKTTYLYKKNYIPIPGASGGQKWRPLSSWSSAWKLGPFYGLFVYPIGVISDKLLHALPPLAGGRVILTIFVVVFMIRFLTLLISFKSILQQTKMQELSAKKAIIDAKYEPYKGNKQMENRKRQEIAEMYKKEGISPLGSFGSLFLTMPFFLAVWRITTSLTIIKSSAWLGITFSATSYKELFAGHLQYLPLMLIAFLFAALQAFLPRLLSMKKNKNINVYQKQAMKKSNRTANIMAIVTIIFALIFTAGIQIYWIAGGIWFVFQTLSTHFFLEKRKHKKGKKSIFNFFKKK